MENINEIITKRIIFPDIVNSPIVRRILGGAGESFPRSFCARKMHLERNVVSALSVPGYMIRMSNFPG
jgi:hypothetical protein